MVCGTWKVTKTLGPKICPTIIHRLAATSALTTAKRIDLATFSRPTAATAHFQMYEYVCGVCVCTLYM